MSSIQLPENAQKIYDALAATPDEWVNRTELARRLNKPRLNPSDTAYLEVMEANHMIEALIGTSTNQQRQWVYRIR